MARHKDRDWKLPESLTWEHVQVAVLMDIRDEFFKLNRLLHCSNFQDIPRRLNAIKTATARIPRKKRKLKK